MLNIYFESWHTNYHGYIYQVCNVHDPQTNTKGHMFRIYKYGMIIETGQIEATADEAEVLARESIDRRNEDENKDDDKESGGL